MNPSAAARGPVVVGVDDSPSGVAALGWATHYAREAGLALRAVHVAAFDAQTAAIWTPGYPGMSFLTEDRTAEPPTWARVQQLFADTGPAADWTCELHEGPIGPALVRVAAEATLLVVGTHEHTGIHRLLAGSVSHYCLSHAACPVAAVPAGADPRARAETSGRVREIVVGLDDSASARMALRWAVAHATHAGQVVRAVHVLGWPLGEADAAIPPPRDHAPRSVEEAQASYRSAITRLFDEIDPRPNWLLQFAEGHPGAVLVRQARAAEFLVVGTREQVGLGRLLLGSVSHYCLSHAVTPVIAVPAAARERPRR